MVKGNNKLLETAETGGSYYLPGMNAVLKFKGTDSKDTIAWTNTPPTPVTKKGVQYRGFVRWGIGDDLPQKIVEMTGKSEVLSAGLKFNIDAGYGMGIVAGKWEVNEKGERSFKPVYDNQEINKFFEENDINGYLLEQLTDANYFYNVFPEIILNRDDPDKRKVVTLRSKDATFSRLESMNPDTGHIEHHFYSGKFGVMIASEDDIDVTEVLKPFNTAKDLLQRIGREANDNGKKQDQGVYRYIIPINFSTPGRIYYPEPYWYTCIRSGWYDYSCKIPEYKNALLDNGMTLKYHVELDCNYFKDIFKEEGITDDGKKKARMKKEFDDINKFLTSPKNTGKSFVSYITYDATGNERRKVKITVLDDKYKGGEYLEDSEEASNIMNYALGVHPSIVGAAPGKSKTINGTEARELFIIKQTLLKSLRDRLLKPLYVIKAVNKWDTEIDFCIPNIELTTLDKNPTGQKQVTN